MGDASTNPASDQKAKKVQPAQMYARVFGVDLTRRATPTAQYYNYYAGYPAYPQQYPYSGTYGGFYPAQP
jgi:hypothetical protein